MWIARLLLLLPFAASFGCADDTTYASYRVAAVGPTMRVATGESASVVVEISSTETHEYLGCGPGPVVPTLVVDDVTCAPDCTVSGAPGREVAVSSRTPGVVNVRIATSTSDGKTQVTTAVVEFRDVTEITAVREATSPSGTAYAMVKGDAQQWELAAGDAKGPLYIEACHLEVRGAGAVASGEGCTPSEGKVGAIVASVRGASAGSGTLTTRYGSVLRTDRITVIDPARVRRAELREVQLAGSLSVESAAAVRLTPARDPLVVRFRCPEGANPVVVPWLQTEDGTVALGGTIALYTEPAHALDLGLVNQVSRVSMVLPFDGTLRAAFGARGEVALSAPYIVRSGCPSVDRDPDAGTDGDVDASQDGDGGSDAGADAGAEDGGR